MADAPQPRPQRLVIPLHPERAAEQARVRLPAALLDAIRRVRVPAELAALVRVNTVGALQFVTPALLLAMGAALLALLVGSVAAALGVREVSAGAIAITAGRWTLLATTGGALSVMETLVREKFTRHPALAAQLLATGDLELVERNHWRDTFWGICDGRGENHLGRILMKVRTELQGA